jgi:hypothetical protein
VRRGRLLWFSRGAIADRRAYELRATTPPAMPERNREHARLRFLVLPHASPLSQTGVGKQKTLPHDRHKILISLIEFGAGEGIRALDPNLGKVGGGH